MNWKKQNAKIIVGTLIALSATQSFAAGFEKTVMWSGRWAGVAGAAAGAVEGADSLFYNPAGLVQGGEREVSLNYSPLFTQTSGAQTTNNEKLDSKHLTKHVFGATSKININKDIAVGAGLYVSGGSGSEFDYVDFSGINANYRDLKPAVKSDVKILEVGLGGAYRLTQNLSAGVTWRTSIAQADFSSADVSLTSSGNALINTVFKEMKGENYEGFRLGLQYANNEKTWGLGASYRSSIDLSLDGSASGEAEFAANGANLKMTGGNNVTLSTAFPQQLNFGGFYKYNEHGTFFAEYSWTDYSENKEIKISGDALNLATTNVLAGKSIVLKWHDAHALKVGNEYYFGNWALRTGYALTSRVTDKSNVSITFTAPSLGHSFTLGTGTSFMNKTLFLDISGEFSTAKGDGARSNGISGEYTSQALGLHTSIKYLF